MTLRSGGSGAGYFGLRASVFMFSLLQGTKNRTEPENPTGFLINGLGQAQL